MLYVELGRELERGAIANPDENRMVGHYWLRASKLAPTAELTKAIDDSLAQIRAFTADVHAGRLLGSTGKKFTQLLVVGIGGSALGPQLVNHALGQPGADKMAVSFFDNTDPDGIDYVLAQLAGKLPETLVVVISKSGGTVETRVGGKADDRHGAPVAIAGRVRLLSDGRWVHEGPENAGVPAEPGPTAVIEVDGVTLVLNSRKIAPGDQQQLKSVSHG